MEDLMSIVEKLSEQYKANRNSIPEAETIEKELHSMSGIGREMPHSLVMIMLDSPHMAYAGSSCGTSENRVFQSKSLVSFLRNRGVRYVVGIVYEPKDPETYERGFIPLSSVALPIAGRDGHIFQSIVSKSNGSFRYERSRVNGWSVYESE
ncbi:MAG: hypothetical protein QME12_06765 [Nanoarchaeota archaeon]|nr:hypothetical protein [Nanoarchaeota archaeon]